MNIYNVLEKIRATASKKEKEAILKANDSPELREYLYSVYNPQYNYYMKKIPLPVVNGRDLLPYFSVSRELLEQLRTRALTGHAAISAVASTLGRLAPEDRELLRYTLLGDVQAGFGISTINKAFGKAFIFEPPYQRCETEGNANFDKWDWNLNVKHLCQMKADGMFVNIIKKQDGITFMTRGGNVFPVSAFPTLAWHVNDDLPLNHVTHGELVVYQDGKALPRTKSNGILNSALQGAPIDTVYTVKALVWDCVEVGAWELGETPVCYGERLERLKQNLHSGSLVYLIETHEVESIAEAKALALNWMKLGYEGAVVKNVSGGWKDHTSPHQVKIKASLEVELRIVGMLDGKATGKNADTFGSLDMVSEDEKLRVAVTGFSDELRQYIFDNWHEEFYGQVCTVKANQLLMPSKSNKHYSLFLPNYVELRHDRKEADDIERIISIFKPYQPDLK
jgi:DNA ligase-1